MLPGIVCINAIIIIVWMDKGMFGRTYNEHGTYAHMGERKIHLWRVYIRLWPDGIIKSKTSAGAQHALY